MTWLNLLSHHPVIAAIEMVAVTWLAERVFLATAGAVALALHGPYRGQIVTNLDRLGIFTVALALMCAPVFVLMVV